MTAFKKVFKAEIQNGGSSILRAGMPLGCVWELTLECGHVVYRQPRYSPLARGKHKADWYHRRSSDDALAPPNKIHCKQCK